MKSAGLTWWAVGGVMALASAAMGQLVLAPGVKPAETVWRNPERDLHWSPPRPLADSVSLPNLPYESLVVRDADGRLVPLREDTHLAALRRNPLLDDSSLERFEGVFASRRDKVERCILRRLDLVQRLEEGVVSRMHLSDRQSVVDVLEAVRPFQELGNLTDDLLAAKYLDQRQYAFNWKIVRQYEMAMMDQATADAGALRGQPDRHSAISRHAMDEIVREARGAYEAMVREGAGRIDAAMAGIEYPAERAGLAVPLRERVRRERDSVGGVEATRELLGMMDLEQRRRFFENVRATR